MAELNGWLSCPTAHNGMVTLASALRALGIAYDYKGFHALRVGTINHAQRDDLVALLRGLAATSGWAPPPVTGWLPEATPEAREWQVAEATRALVKEFTSGDCYNTQNPYTRECVILAQCAVAGLTGGIPEPAIGVPLADIPLWREA